MRVDDTDGLQERIYDGFPHELHATPLQFLGYGIGQRGRFICKSSVFFSCSGHHHTAISAHSIQGKSRRETCRLHSAPAPFPQNCPDGHPMIKHSVICLIPSVIHLRGLWRNDRNFALWTNTKGYGRNQNRRNEEK